MTIRIATVGAALVLALSGAAAFAQSAGVTAAVNQSALGTPPGMAVRTISLGDHVIQNERIDTNAGGLVQILLADGTTFTIGPNSSLSIDRFVYDPNAGTAEVAATLSRGALRFIGGRASKAAGGARLTTPVGTVGIRGAIANVNLGPGMPGVEAHFDLLFGDELVLFHEGAEYRVYESGYSLVIGSDGTATIIRTPPGFVEAIQQAMTGAPGTSGGSTNPPTSQTIAESGLPGTNSSRPAGQNDPGWSPPPWGPWDPDGGQELEMQLTLDLIRQEIENAMPPPSSGCLPYCD